MIFLLKNHPAAPLGGVPLETSIRYALRKKEEVSILTQLVTIEIWKNLICLLGLFDIPTSGKRFTWFRPNGQAVSRLDRALVSSEWLGTWPHSR